MRKLTSKEFKDRATHKHGEGTWDYSKVEYKNKRTPVEIVCHIHGSFWQTPDNHLNQGSGCPKCGLLKIAEKVRKATSLKKNKNIVDMAPEGSKAVPLTQGKYALVDEEDYERVMEYNWYFSKGYAVGSIGGKKLPMHRFIMNTPDGMDTDHKFHNTLDNRKCNLRVCTRKQNSANSRPIKSTSKYKGVHWSKKDNKWVAKIFDRGERVIGYYKDEVEAAEAYDRVAKELRGDFAYLNFKKNTNYGI